MSRDLRKINTVFTFWEKTTLKSKPGNNLYVHYLVTVNKIWYIQEWDTSWQWKGAAKIDEPQKHCAQWKKPDTEEYILPDSISMKCPEKENIKRQNTEVALSWGKKRACL